jgi:glutamate dehydrogenase (NADP+)
VQKVNQLGGKVVTLSDSNGTILDEEGINEEKWRFLMELKNQRRGPIAEYTGKFKRARYVEGERPWRLTNADIALPSATQNELDLDDAKALVAGGCVCVSEGANMPATLEATEYLIARNVLFGPGKAANAGGVACSGLEMSQNSMRLSWSSEEVDEKLQRIMVGIHSSCRQAALEYNTPDNYVNGANIAGFKKVADAMIDQGLV